MALQRRLLLLDRRHLRPLRRSRDLLSRALQRRTGCIPRLRGDVPGFLSALGLCQHGCIGGPAAGFQEQIHAFGSRYRSPRRQWRDFRPGCPCRQRATNRRARWRPARLCSPP
ncbi:hypothetical protein BOSE127_110288 [Bosea sp. 127]|nr:hypothetical protein BOSE127_110288 [Bosea sp. 127]